MKRVFFVIIISIACFVIPVVLFAASDTSYDTALKYYARGNYQETVKHLTEYIQQKPDPAAYYLLGYSLYELGRFAEADEYFSQAYLIDPTFTPEQIGLSKKYPPVKTKAAKKPPKRHKHKAVKKESGPPENKPKKQEKQAQTPKKCPPVS